MTSTLSNFNLKMQLLRSELQDQLHSAMAKKSTQVYSAICMTLVCASPVLADDDFFGTLVDQLTNLYSSILPVINICALIMCAIAIAFWMLSNDQQSSRAGQQWAKRIFIGWLIIGVLPWAFIKGHELLGDEMTSGSLDAVKDIGK